MHPSTPDAFAAGRMHCCRHENTRLDGQPQRPIEPAPAIALSLEGIRIGDAVGDTIISAVGPPAPARAHAAAKKVLTSVTQIQATQMNDDGTGGGPVEQKGHAPPFGLLRELIRFTERSPANDGIFSAVVVVQGLIVSGQLISTARYHDLFAEPFLRVDPNEKEAEFARRAATQLFDSLKQRAIEAADGLILHLRDTIMLTGGTRIRLQAPGLWRSPVNQLGGFTLGSIPFPVDPAEFRLGRDENPADPLRGLSPERNRLVGLDAEPLGREPRAPSSSGNA